MDYILTPKNANKFNCETCDFRCSKQSEYDRHLSTRKHQTNYKGVTMDYNLTQKNANHFVCECGNIYKIRREK